MPELFWKLLSLMGAKKDKGQVLPGIVRRSSGAVLYARFDKRFFTKESANTLVPVFLQFLTFQHLLRDACIPNSMGFWIVTGFLRLHRIWDTMYLKVRKRPGCDRFRMKLCCRHETGNQKIGFRTAAPFNRELFWTDA